MADGKGTYIDKNTEINVVMLNQRYNNNVDEDLTLYAIWEDTKIPEPEGPKPEHPKPEPEIPWDIIFWGGEGSVTHKEHIAYIIGYPDGTVKPENQITRAELATMATRFRQLSGESTIKNDFSDIGDHWATYYINQAFENKWIEGYEDGTFRPNRDITRAEMATMTNRMLERGGNPKYVI